MLVGKIRFEDGEILNQALLPLSYVSIISMVSWHYPPPNLFRRDVTI